MVTWLTYQINSKPKKLIEENIFLVKHGAMVVSCFQVHIHDNQWMLKSIVGDLCQKAFLFFWAMDCTPIFRYKHLHNFDKDECEKKVPTCHCQILLLKNPSHKTLNILEINYGKFSSCSDFGHNPCLHTTMQYNDGWRACNELIVQYFGELD